MTPERWREIRAAFDRLAALAPDERETALSALAEVDGELAREARSLLAAEARDAQFMSRPAGGAADRRGELIGPWELLSPLGEGGMGRVFLARRADASFDKLVAVKFVHAELLSPLLRERFAAERQALAALEHPGIARLLDGGESASGEPYLVLEYVEGQSLLAFATSRELSRRERLGLFLQVLAAVANAHRHLVVHRDIKPANILVNAAGEAKLLDFGVAKILTPIAEAAGATRTLLRALTPEYASPEQVLGGATTTATDIYSLGIVLFELLTGRRPYRIATGAPEEWAEAALHQEVTRTPELPRDLEAIVLRALRKPAAERYPTVDAFAEDLRRFLDGRPVGARRGSLAYRAAKFAGRHRGALAATAIALTVLAATVAVAGVRLRRERDLAQRRFSQVRELAGVFLFDVHDAIAPLAGSTEARSLLIGTGLRYLDQLAADAGEDLDLAREIAGGYERLGKLQGAIALPNLGKSQDALTSQEKALRIREQLVKRRPTDPAPARELAQSELAMGQALVRLGRMREAPAHSARAVAALEGLAELDQRTLLTLTAAQRIELQRERGETLAAHGFLTAAAGDTAGAGPAMDRAVAILDQLLREHPEEVPIAAALSMALFRSAQIQVERGGSSATTQAQGFLDRALIIDRDLMKRSPSLPGVRRRLASDLAKRSQLQATSGNHEAALVGYAEVLALVEADRARDPSDALAHRHACVMRVRSATSLLALDRGAEARSVVTPAVEDLAAMLSSDPGNAFLELSLADATLRLGQSLHRLARSKGGDEPPAQLLRRAHDNVAAAVERLTPMVENGTLTGTDAELLAEARRELATLAVR
jgi:tRNA A-37 threonylcarbamoyl transferase component Bud32